MVLGSMKTYRCQLTVRGYELDSFGHVNHAIYLRYLEHARWEMLAQEGITLSFLEERKRWPIIRKIEAEYLKPAFMGEVLDVVTQCVDHGKASSIFKQSIERGGVEIFRARIHSATINELGKPARHPVEMERLWEGN
jgi:YbgC/YbaW family acyl-CoA thioester hydrolase